MHIRLCVLMALASVWVSRRLVTGVRVNAFRAASMYYRMAARMTQLLQEHAAMIVPDFVAADVTSKPLLKVAKCPGLRPGILLVQANCLSSRVGKQ